MNQEQLRAHNTPISKTCRDLVERFNDIKKLLIKKDDALLFQMILHMYLTLKNGVDNFQGPFSCLSKFVKLHEELPVDYDEIVNRTLTTISNIASDADLADSLTKRDDHTYHLKTAELLVFMVFRKEVGRPRSLRAYAKDF